MREELYRRARQYAKARSLLAYFIQSILCFSLFRGIILGGLAQILSMLEMPPLPVFWNLFLSSIMGFALSLAIDYHKAPLASCLPLKRIWLGKQLSNKLGKRLQVPNRSFFALGTKQTGCFWGKERGAVFWLLFSLLAGLLVIGFSNLVLQILIYLFPNLPTFQVSGVEKILAELSHPQAFLLLVVVPVIFEELVFRGRGFALLARSWGERSTIFWSAMIFALAHFSPAELISLLPLAFYLGWLRYRSGNLYFSMLVHLLNNGIAFLWYSLFH